PTGIVTGPDGNLWFTNLFGDSIGRATPDGDLATFTDPGLDGPTAIAMGPDGNLWFTSWQHHKVGRITPSGVVTMYPTAPDLYFPRDIVAGPDGALWLVSESDVVARMSVDGDLTPFSDDQIDDPRALVLGSDGNLWFTNMG